METKYICMEEIPHILHRPDTHIGGISKEKSMKYILSAGNRIIQKEISFVPGLLKIVDEILVNAIDHAVNTKNAKGKDRVTRIDVSVSDTGEITVRNNGSGIPIRLTDTPVPPITYADSSATGDAGDGKVLIPEMIFTRFRAGSNFDDNNDKVTGGRNGFGSKLTLVFSEYATIETQSAGKHFLMRVSENMSKIFRPVVTSVNNKESFTKITFMPDYTRFGYKKGMTKDAAALIKKRVYDMAANTHVGVSVYLNDELIPISKFFDYPALYTNFVNESAGLVLKNTISNVIESWEVIVSTPGENAGYECVSYVNGICTYSGGTHVSYITQKLTKGIADYVTKEHKLPTSVRGIDVKDNLFIFLKATVINPTFDSQSKCELTLPIGKSGFSCIIPDTFIKKVCALRCHNGRTMSDNLARTFQFKVDSKVIKSDQMNTKKSKIHMEKLHDAVFAGTRRSLECSLILTEGDSALTTALSGIGANRDTFGAYPLRGKIKNVSEMTAAAASEHVVIKNLKTIIGLQHNRTYATEAELKTLRYGKVILFCDADEDALQIRGLCILVFTEFWPHLLERPDFMSSIITPIVKCKYNPNLYTPITATNITVTDTPVIEPVEVPVKRTRGKGKGKATSVTAVSTPKGKDVGVIEFYSLVTFNEFKDQNDMTKFTDIKYYKGLGSSNKHEAQEYFKNLDRNQVFNCFTPECKNAVSLAFDKKRADDRKEWLRNYDKSDFIKYTGQVMPAISYTDFVHKELKHYSHYDVARSLPNVIDGLKISLRKIMFGCFKRNLYTDIKVAQLGGYVSEHSHYHHGEQSLFCAIIKLAQDFVGSNNVNFLVPSGQFGSRLEGGSDAASPRYIHTRLSNVIPFIFNEYDTKCTVHQEDNNSVIEPEYYTPVIPVILLNGSVGIGTGWNCSVLQYNPFDIINILRCRLGCTPVSYDILPWYKGFKGKIIKTADSSYITLGVYTRLTDTAVAVTEIPIGMWIEQWKNKLTTLTEKNGVLTDFDEGGDESNINYTLHFTSKAVLDNLIAGKDHALEKAIFLYSTLKSRINVINSDGGISELPGIESVFDIFFAQRMTAYTRRKEYQLQDILTRLHNISTRVHFLTGYISGDITITNAKTDDIYNSIREYLRGCGHELSDVDIKKLHDTKMSALSEDNLTKLRVSQSNTQAEYNKINSMSDVDMYYLDLELLEAELRKPEYALC